MQTRRALVLAAVLALATACANGDAPRDRPRGEPKPSGTAEQAIVAEEDFETDAGPFSEATSDAGSIGVADGKLTASLVGEGTVTSDVAIDPPAQIVRIEAEVGASGEARAVVGCVAGAQGREYRFTVGPGDSTAIYRVTEDGGMTELGTGPARGLVIVGSIDFRAECLGQGPGLPTRLILYDCSQCDEVAVDVEDPNGLGDITAVSLGGEQLGGEPGRATFDDVRITRY